MNGQTIEIARDFSATPGGRFRSDGRFSGEVFRDDILVPRLNSGAVTVVLDGVEGYGSSFLEEAFGGLIRVHHIPLNKLRSTLRIVANDKLYARYADRAWKYIEEASSKP